MAIYLGTNKVELGGTDGAGYMPGGKVLATKTYSFNLGQTNYSSITPTTTAQSLTLPATDFTAAGGTTMTCFKIGEAFDGTVINRDLHDYIVLFTTVITYNYGTNNVSSTIHGIKSSFARDYHEGKYRGSVDSSTGQLTSTYSKAGSYITNVTPLLYQKADNTYSLTTSQGIYHSGSTICSFGTSNGKDYLELRCGTYSVKYSDTYCPLASLTAINPANTIIQCTWYIYEGDKSMYTNIYDTAYELVANS